MHLLSLFKPYKRQTAGAWLEAFCNKNQLDFEALSQPYSKKALRQPVSHEFEKTFLNYLNKVTPVSQAAAQAISFSSPAQTSSYPARLFTEADMLTYIRNHSSRYRALAEAAYHDETQRLEAERSNNASGDTFLTP